MQARREQTMSVTPAGRDRREKDRIANLLALLPRRAESALDVGPNGHTSALLAGRFERVAAIDFDRALKDAAAAIATSSHGAELVVCAEGLERVPQRMLADTCGALCRVSNRYVLVGVPYEHDVRVGRTTCGSCGTINPPWGHGTRFNEPTLRALFRPLSVVRATFAGVAETRTNALASWLLDLAGNPYGTYSQDEPCVRCGARLTAPSQLTFGQKLLTRLAGHARNAHRPFMRVRPNWIHVLFEKRPSAIAAQQQATRPADQYAGSRFGPGQYAGAELDK